MKPSLYRHFAEDGTLLYVGASLRFMDRQYAHTRVSVWWDDVAKVTVEWFDTKELLMAAEKVAIQNERPLNNLFYLEKIKRPDKYENFPPAVRAWMKRRSVGIDNLAYRLGVKKYNLWAMLTRNMEMTPDVTARVEQLVGVPASSWWPE